MAYTLMALPAFCLMGIQIQTDNSRFMADAEALWQRFYSENIQQQIPNKLDAEVLAVYGNYEGDYTKPFVYTIGCRVAKTDNIPAGMVIQNVPAQKYALFTATGAFPQSVATTWQAIWVSPLKRAYRVDFELYGKEFGEENKEVKIFIGLEQ